MKGASGSRSGLGSLDFDFDDTNMTSPSESNPLLLLRSLIYRHDIDRPQQQQQQQQQHQQQQHDASATTFSSLCTAEDDEENQCNNKGNDEISINAPLKIKWARIPNRIGVIDVVVTMMIMLIVLLLLLQLLAPTVTNLADVVYPVDSATSAVIIESIADTTIAAQQMHKYSGPYKLVEEHIGGTYLDHYDFYVGQDSEGSTG